MKARILLLTLLICAITSVSKADEQKAFLDSVLIMEVGGQQSKNEYLYNEDGYVSTEVYYNLNGGAWQAKSIREYSYNEFGKVEISVMSLMDNNTNLWKKERKSEYSYNDKGDQILRTDYKWNSDEEIWEIYQLLKTTYRYATYSDHITYTIDSLCNSEGEPSRSAIRYDYTYDNNTDRVTHRFSFIWDEGAGDWAQTGKRDYTYDAEGNLILILSYNWIATSKKFVNASKYEMEYDTNRYLLTEKASIWTDDNSWFLTNTSTYYYHNYNTALTQLEISPQPKSTKLLRDGQMFIIRDGKTYSVTGNEVK